MVDGNASIPGADGRVASQLRKGVLEYCVQINQLENEADHIYQEAVRKLFEVERDPIVIIKWKDMFEVLEQVTDACEDVANVIESIVVKHG